MRSVEAQWLTDYLVGVDQCGELVRCLRTTTTLNAVRTAAKLASFRCVDPRQVDPRPMHFRRVAVDESSKRASLPNAYNSSSEEIIWVG